MKLIQLTGLAFFAAISLWAVLPACAADTLGLDVVDPNGAPSDTEFPFPDLWNRLEVVPEFREPDAWRLGFRVDENILPNSLRALITRRNGAIGKGNFKDKTWIGAVSHFSADHLEDNPEPLPKELPPPLKDHYRNQAARIQQHESTFDEEAFLRNRLERYRNYRSKIVTGQLHIRICNAPTPRAAFEYIVIEAGVSPLPIEAIASGFSKERKVDGLGTIGFDRGVGDVVFIRDNIAVSIRGTGVFGKDSLDIAKKIDAKLQEKPKLTYDELLTHGAIASVQPGKRDMRTEKRDATLTTITPQGQSVAYQEVWIDGKRIIPKDGKFSIEKESGRAKVEIGTISDELIRSHQVIEINLDELPGSEAAPQQE